MLDVGCSDFDLQGVREQLQGQVGLEKELPEGWSKTWVIGRLPVRMERLLLDHDRGRVRGHEIMFEDCIVSSVERGSLSLRRRGQ